MSDLAFTRYGLLRFLFRCCVQPYKSEGGGVSVQQRGAQRVQGALA